MVGVITIIGSLNYDLVTYTKRIPNAGETYAAKSFESHLGGKGLNEAIASARLSPSEEIKVRMVGNVGTDSFGTELKAALVDANIDTTFIRTIQGQSGVAVILVEEDSGENRILITSGANGELKPSNEDYETYFPESKIQVAQYVIIQNEYPDTLNSINWINSNRANINVAYNPSPFNSDYITPQLLLKVDLLIVNEGEANDIAKTLLNFDTRESSGDLNYFKRLAKQLFEKINSKNIQTVIITMGSQGCVYIGKEVDEVQFTAAVTVDKVIDTTGAGDTFFGGVVLQLANGSSLRQAIEFATMASSIVVQSKGAVESIPFYKDVKVDK